MLVSYRPLGPKTRFLGQRRLPQPSRGLHGRLGRPKEPDSSSKPQLRNHRKSAALIGSACVEIIGSVSSAAARRTTSQSQPARAFSAQNQSKNRCPGRRTAAPRAQRPHITNEARETTPGPTTRRRRAAGQRRPFRRAGPKPRSARRSKTSLQQVGGGKPSPGGVGF